MKSLKEAAPVDLDAVKRRAIRDYAMGRIDKTECDYVSDTTDGLKSFIQNIEEREEGI